MPGAFPEDIYYDEKRIGQVPGMNLADYFAAQALAGSLASGEDWQDCDSLAAWAYDCAEAMIAQRRIR